MININPGREVLRLETWFLSGITHMMKGESIKKFQHLSVGPFQIVEKLGPSTYKLQHLQGWEENLLVNGLALKLYFT